MAMPAPTMRQVSVARSRPISTCRFARAASRATLIGVGDDWQANGLTVYFCTNGVGTLLPQTTRTCASSRIAAAETLWKICVPLVSFRRRQTFLEAGFPDRFALSRPVDPAFVFSFA